MVTYHIVNVEAHRQPKVDECDTYGHLELVDEYANKACLENVCVEEEQEDDNDGEHDTNILNPETMHGSLV